MAISGVTDYTNTYAGYTNSANGKKQATEGAGTAKEAVARKTAKDELSYLTEKYECMKSKDYSVNINSSLLAKATSDEKTSEWLEYNLSLIPKVVDNIKSAAAARGAKMISCDITMNGYDSMTTEVVTQVEVDPGTEKAREELIHKNSKISDIALQNGFSSETQFISSFKNVFGLTPLKYRKLYCEDVPE